MPPATTPDIVPAPISPGSTGRSSSRCHRVVLLCLALALAGCAHQVPADNRASTVAAGTSQVGAIQSARALDARVSDLEARLDRDEYALLAVNRRAIDAQRHAACALARDTCAAVLPASPSPQSSIAPAAVNPQATSQSITASVGRLMAAAHRASPVQSP